MNHKRKGPKSTRAGCLHCKPHKDQRAKDSAHAQTLQERRAREAESGAVIEYHHERLAEAADLRLLWWEPRNRWPRPSMDEVRWRLAHPEPAPSTPSPEPAWGLMAHAFRRGA